MRFRGRFCRPSLERVKNQVVDVWSKIETADHNRSQLTGVPVARLRRQWTSLAHTQSAHAHHIITLLSIIKQSWSGT